LSSTTAECNAGVHFASLQEPVGQCVTMGTELGDDDDDDTDPDGSESVMFSRCHSGVVSHTLLSSYTIDSQVHVYLHNRHVDQ
jgi:hypothetical protein